MSAAASGKACGVITGRSAEHIENPVDGSEVLHLLYRHIEQVVRLGKVIVVSAVEPVEAEQVGFEIASHSGVLPASTRRRRTGRRPSASARDRRPGSAGARARGRGRRSRSSPAPRSDCDGDRSVSRRARLLVASDHAVTERDEELAALCRQVARAGHVVGRRPQTGIDHPFEVLGRVGVSHNERSLMARRSFMAGTIRS